MYELKYHDDALSNYSFLVTGGAGFIGSNIVEYLLKYGAKKVRVLDNFSTGFKENTDLFKNDPAFELIEGDIRNIETCAKAVENIDYVFHQAALGSVPRSINDPILTNEVNVSGFLNMLVASKDAKIKKFVYAASSSTYGDHAALPKKEDIIGNPLSPYAITKYVNELYAGVFSKVYGFHTIGLRYFNIFGPRQSPTGAYAAVIPLFIKAAIDGENLIINGDGETSRDFTFVENAVQANIRAVLSPNLNQHEIFNVACGDQVTLNNLAALLGHIANKKLNINYGPERKGDVRHSKASIEKIKTHLKYQPEFNFQQGLEIVYKWYENSFVNNKTIIDSNS